MRAPQPAALAEAQPRELALGGLDRHPLAQIQHQQLELVAQHRRQLVVEAGQRIDDRIQTTVHADEPVHRLGDPAPSAAGQLAPRAKCACDDVGGEPPLGARLGGDLQGQRAQRGI